MKFEDVLPALRRGEKVRREIWSRDTEPLCKGDRIAEYHLTTNALLADDWEVVSEHAPCWNCGGRMMMSGVYRHYVVCLCGVQGPHSETEAEAWRLWDAHAGRG